MTDSSNAENKWKYLNEPLKSRLRKNSISNIIFFLVTFPILFIVTPIILKFVGKEIYGVWALTGTILVFVELIGGLQSSTALGIVIPEYEPEKQNREINEIINTFFVFYFINGIILCILYFISENFLINTFFKVKETELNTVRFVLSVSFYLFIVNFILTGYAHLLASFNITYVHNILHIIIGYMRLGLMVYFLFKGFGINGVVVIQMLTTIFETLLIIIITKKMFPAFKINPLLFKINKLKLLLSLSVKIFITRAAALVNYNFDKLVLGYLLNPVTVSYYQIGASITKYIATIPDMLGMPSLLPAAAELKSKNKNEKILILYNKANKYILFTAIFLSAGILIFGKEFLNLWLGMGYEDAYTVLIFLCICYTYNLAGYAPVFILNGMGKLNEPMLASIITAVINIILSTLLAIKYGLKGALTGTVISMFIGATVLFIIFYKITGYMVEFKKIFVKPVIAGLLAYVPVYFINTNLKAENSLTLFSGKIILFTLVFIIFIFVFKYFDKTDMELLKVKFLKKS